MKTQIKKIGMLLMAFLLLSWTGQAQMTIIPTTTPACADSTGAVTFTVSGGTGTTFYTLIDYANGGYYQYPAQTSPTFTHLWAGAYAVYVNNSTDSGQLYFSVPTVVNGQLSATNATCSQSNGSVAVTASGGTTPYSYHWSNGTNANPLLNVPAGYYAVTVTDANGCVTGIDSLVAVVRSISPDSAAIHVSGTTCNPSLTAFDFGGPAPYTYIWNYGDTTATIACRNGQQTYSVTVTDANGCTASASTSLNSDILSVGLNNAVITRPNCGSSDGAITIYMYTGATGTGPLTFQWAGYAPTTDSTISGLAAGSYTVTVTDANGCSAAQTFTLTQTYYLNLNASTVIYPNCLGGTGSITLHVDSGSGPYTYHWSNSATDSTLTGLAPGIYFVTVSNAGGCTAQDTFNLNSTQLNGYVYTVTNPSCTGTAGAIAAYVYGGSGTYTYHWSNAATTDTISNLAPGIYSVTITDANTGCSAIVSDTLINTSPLWAYFYVQNPACGASNGSLDPVVYNGSGVYTYAWSNGASTDSLGGIAAGIYTLTVTDVNSGCSSSFTGTLLGVGNYQVNITTTPTSCDTSLHTGTATANITGSGTAPYSFRWYEQSTLVDTDQTITGLSSNYYSLGLIVTDANGCIPDSVSGNNGGHAGDTAFEYISIDPSCYDHITGYVYNDSNGNCIRDTGETGMTLAYVIAQGATGPTYYGSPDNTGYYDIKVPTGIYTVTITLFNYGSCNYTVCVNQYTDTFTAIGQVSAGNDFGLDPSGGGFNLGVHPGCMPSAPGSQKEYWVDYYNYGATANNVVVSFTHDPSLTLVSTNPPYTSYNSATHVVSWYIGTLPGSTNWTQITMEFDVPSSDSLGAILYGQAEIDPITGDCDPSNNTVNCSQPVVGSQDPNEKSVVPAGNLSESDSVLTYTIRFQNTGNAPANTIVVVDTLSPNVDPATVTPGASSAPYTFNLSGNGIMTFTFRNINLPDSSHGNSSIGFVTYTVHTKPNLALGTTINNTAYIYFDANPAVVTNTTTNERSNNTGIRTVNGSNMSAEVIPNPAHDIASIAFNGATGTIALRITDALGNVIATSNVDSKAYTLNASDLASGIYFYTAQDADGNRAAGRISVVH